MENNNSDNVRLRFPGIVLITTAVVVSVIFHFVNPDLNTVVTFVCSLVASAGVALIVIDMVESGHLRRALDLISDKIVATSAEKMREHLNETISLLDKAESCGLDDVLYPRRNRDEDPSTVDHIRDVLLDSRDIRICCISGLEFFRKPRGSLVSGGPYYQALQEMMGKNSMPELDTLATVRTLLADPNNETAKFRNRIESLPDAVADMTSDINSALEGIRVLNRIAKRNFIQCKTSPVFPTCWFVLTEHCLFVEMYHFAPTKSFTDYLNRRGDPTADQYTNCTGGRIPVLQFNRGSSMYGAMELHFEELWNSGSDINWDKAV